jgi:hypothetical protein
MDIKDFEKVRELRKLIEMCNYIISSGGITLDNSSRFYFSKHSHPIIYNALVLSAKDYKEVLIAQLEPLGVTFSEVK